MKRLFVVFLGTFLLGIGCSTPTVPRAATDQHSTSEWVAVDQGVEKIEMELSASSKGRLILYRFSPTSTYDWVWESATSAHTIADWKKSFSNATLISNGVYFNEDNTPTGLMIIHGKRIGPRRFDDDKSGMIDLSSPVRIINTKHEPLDPKLMDQVAQSYPFLITDSQLALQTDSGLTARRTFIGKDSLGNTYLGICTEPISLYELAKKILEMHVPWQEVINLDGGPSSGLVTHFVHDQTTINSYVGVPNVIVVTRTIH